MSDDLSKKLKQITDLLGQENMPDNIKGLLSVLASSTPTDNNSSSSSRPSDTSAEKSQTDDSIEMVRKVKSMMDRAKSAHDPRVNLLSAIKPFLNNNRQQKLGNCIMLLQMTALTKFLDENEK